MRGKRHGPELRNLAEVAQCCQNTSLQGSVLLRVLGDDLLKANGSVLAWCWWHQSLCNHLCFPCLSRRIVNGFVWSLSWWCSRCLFSPLSPWKNFHSWAAQHVRKYICVIISRVFSSLLFGWVCFTLYNFPVQFTTSLLLIAQTDRNKKQLADKKKARSLLLMVVLAYMRLNRSWDYSVWWSILYARKNVIFSFLNENSFQKHSWGLWLLYCLISWVQCTEVICHFPLCYRGSVAFLCHLFAL